MLFRMVLWWCSMMEVLLFSNDEKIFNLTNSVIDGRYKLTWCTYKSLEKKTCPYPYPCADGRRNTAKYFFNINSGCL